MVQFRSCHYRLFSVFALAFSSGTACSSSDKRRFSESDYATKIASDAKMRNELAPVSPPNVPSVARKASTPGDNVTISLDRAAPNPDECMGAAGFHDVSHDATTLKASARNNSVLTVKKVQRLMLDEAIDLGQSGKDFVRDVLLIEVHYKDLHRVLGLRAAPGPIWFLGTSNLGLAAMLLENNRLVFLAPTPKRSEDAILWRYQTHDFAQPQPSVNEIAQQLTQVKSGELKTASFKIGYCGQRATPLASEQLHSHARALLLD